LARGDTDHETIDDMPLTPTPSTERAPGACAACAGHADCLFYELLCQESADQVQCLSGLITERAFRKGDVLVAQGKPGETLGVVKAGHLMATRTGPDGASRPVAILGRSQVLGTTGPAGQAGPFSKVALSDGRLCEVPLAQLETGGLLGTPLLMAALRSHGRTLSRLAEWARIQGLKGVVARLEAGLRLLAEVQHSQQVFIPSHSLLAQLLGSSRESLVRAMSRLEANGVLTRKGRSYVLLNDAPVTGHARVH
jgi:CRP/FNR family transcriptional regulator, cyclic AMP receptor protein